MGQPLTFKLYSVSLINSKVKIAGTDCGWRRLLNHGTSPAGRRYQTFLPDSFSYLCLRFLFMGVVLSNPCLWSVSQSNVSSRSRSLLRRSLDSQFSPLFFLCAEHKYAHLAVSDVPCEFRQALAVWNSVSVPSRLPCADQSLTIQLFKLTGFDSCSRLFLLRYRRLRLVAVMALVCCLCFLLCC